MKVKRLLESEEGPIASLNIKRIRVPLIDRLRMLAARRRWTLEYATDRVIEVGLDAYDAEDKVK